jgi:hypothetical protein
MIQHGRERCIFFLAGMERTSGDHIDTMVCTSAVQPVAHTRSAVSHRFASQQVECSHLPASMDSAALSRMMMVF